MRRALLVPTLLLPILAGPASAQQAKPGQEKGKPLSQEPHNRSNRKPNHLKGATSPYLLQHLYNPVDWYEWGKEAIERAKKEDKPVFLSIGYSACHWCHVMERESFESERIAKLMNDNFVCIKVDREERPDIDEIYMAACVRLNRGSGGWPMSMFLTPDLKPFLGGTYFPPTARGGMPGFDDLLNHVKKLWKEQKPRVIEAGVEMTRVLAAEAKVAAAKEVPGAAILTQAVQVAESRFDSTWGGFGPPPKFPHSTELTFLLRYGVRKANQKAVQMAAETLEHMARGGMYDQVGGGFARYSTDREWLAPHFEKMLYDNSQLASLYLEAFQATGKPVFKRIATETLDYVQREMVGPEGGFYSTTDADSEGEEGKFFVWSLAEWKEVCGDDADVAAAFFRITEGGNFEGHNIVTRRVGIEDFARAEKKELAKVSAAIERVRRKLYERREKRVHPGLDDKILSAWNGLMLSAFAQGAMLFGRADWLQTARKNADFLLTKMRRANGRLWRTRRGDKSHLNAYLEDYAAVTRALTDLYEADPDVRWIKAARELHDIVEEHFVDTEGGGYFTTSDDHEELIVRRSSAQESSLPSDVALAAWNAARLGLLAGEPKLLERARSVLKRHAEELQRYPNAFSQLLILLDFLDANPKEIYIAGKKGDAATDAFLDNARKQWPPYRVFAWVDADNPAVLESILAAADGKTLVDGKAAAYVCTEGVCKEPTTNPALLRSK
ncbi:MAG: thioredoxin domain-containing protein [Planctomycetota bacterium]|nr:thioredoxin domain-containing protein [Planctomycetota bacterium]